MKKLFNLWHSFRASYYKTIAKDCLDIKIKRKLLIKAEHHESKMLRTS